MAQRCSVCRGSGILGQPPVAQPCPLCDGSGEAYQPGRFFTYEVGPVVVALNGHVQAASTQILDKPFRWRMLSGTQTSTNYTLKIYHSGDKRPFSNQEVQSTELVGTAQNPFPLLTPFVFPNKDLIMVDLTDFSGAQNTIRLNFIGEELDS